MNGQCLGDEKFSKQASITANSISVPEHAKPTFNVDGGTPETNYTCDIVKSTVKPKLKLKSTSDSWCLSLLEGLQPSPLTVCLPELTTSCESKALRRSPRLSTPIPEKPLRMSQSSHSSAMRNGTNMTAKVSFKGSHRPVASLSNSYNWSNGENETEDMVNGQCLEGKNLSRKILVRTSSTFEVEDDGLDTTIEMPMSIRKRSLMENESHASLEKKLKKQKFPSYFVGDPVPTEEAQERWRWRYELKVTERILLLILAN